MSVNCEDRTLELNALLDGELPAAEAAELTAHLASCVECSRRLAELGGLRAALAHAIPEEEISAELHARIAKVLSGSDESRVIQVRPRVWWPSLASLAVGAAIAAMVMLAVLPNAHQQGELMAVRDAAMRSGAALAVEGRAPSAPGFRLASAREDVVAGHRAQVLDYVQAGQKVTLCIWPANGEPAHGVREAEYRGMEINYWNDGVREYWAASAGSPAVLASFVARVRGVDAAS